MTLTESELLQARIAEMSNLEFDEWLAGHFEDTYDKGYHRGYSDDYYDNGKYDE